MSNVHYFQRYHTKENTHSANTCLLLLRLFNYNYKLFYNVVSSIFGVESNDLSVQFILQDKSGKKGTIPDFSIIQPGFKLSVEAKEKKNESTFNQLDGHAKRLLSDPANKKFLLLIAPEIGEIDTKNVVNLGSRYPQINCVSITYRSLCDIIEEVLTDIRDDEMIELLNDYQDYCETEKLTIEKDDAIMIRLAGNTFDYDIKNNLYFDSANNNYTGFSYIGLYINKSVKCVGKITKVFKCSYVNKKLIIKTINGCEINDSDRNVIKKGFEYQRCLGDNMTIEYYYYLVDKFVDVNNFKKNSKCALYGKKIFYLSQFGLKKGASAEELASKMSDSGIWS